MAFGKAVPFSAYLASWRNGAAEHIRGFGSFRKDVYQFSSLGTLDFADAA